MIFLPEYYAIELKGSFPLLTATRIMFLIFFVYAFVNRRTDLNFKKIKLPKEYLFIICYFSLRIISNIYYVTTYSQPIKTIFDIIFEQLFLLIAFILLAPTKEEILKIIKSVVHCSAIIFILGIFESLTSIRIFDSLFTVNRTMLNQHYMRFSLMRATATLGMPVIFGNICILILPLILYLFNYTKKRKYLFFVAVDVMAIIHSGCRADIIFFILIMFMYIIFYAYKEKRILSVVKNTFIISIGLLAFVLLLCASNSKYRYYYESTAKSTLNEIGFDFDLTENAPKGIGTDAGNANGSLSRIVQFSGIYYTLGVNPLFGLGSGAAIRNDVYYFSRGHWHTSGTYDVGYVHIFCDEGIIGFIGYISLFIYFLLKVLKNLSSLSSLDRIICFLPITYLICMLSTANIFSILFLYIIIFEHIISPKRGCEKKQ